MFIPTSRGGADFVWIIVFMSFAWVIAYGQGQHHGVKHGKARVRDGSWIGVEHYLSHSTPFHMLPSLGPDLFTLMPLEISLACNSGASV